MDFDEEEVIMLTVVMVASGVGTGVVINWLMYRFWQVDLYGGIAGAVVGLWLWCRAHKWNFWEWADLIAELGFLMIAVASLAYGPEQMIRAGLAVIIWLSLIWLRRHYRKFRWYRSGKVGFVAIVGLGLWSVLEIVVAFFAGARVYFWGLALPQWLGVAVSTVSLVGLYLRGGRKVSEDALKIWQKVQKKR